MDICDPSCLCHQLELDLIGSAIVKCLHDCASTVVSRIYAPRFATLVLVENVGGAYMRDLTFYLANTPPLPVPRLDVHIIITERYRSWLNT